MLFVCFTQTNIELFKQNKILCINRYVSYEYLFRLMDECDEIDWRIFGGRAATKSALDSTLWVGTQGASTPTHYDSYGNNFVVQVCILY